VTTTSESAGRAQISLEPVRYADVGLLLLRLVPFGLLAAHGAQKLFGWFGGPGLAGTAEMFRQMGYEPAGFFALLGGASELAAGVLLILGLFTPLAAAIAIGVMINAFVAMFGSALDVIGYPIVMGTIAVALVVTGPGRYSIDSGRPWLRTGPVWAALAIGLGVVAAVLSLLGKS
jgi:putative oxidoreductase